MFSKKTIFTILATLLVVFLVTHFHSFFGVIPLGYMAKPVQPYEMKPAPNSAQLGMIKGPMPQRGGGMGGMMMESSDRIMPINPGTPNNPQGTNRIIIRNGQINLVVKNVLESRSKISTYVEQEGGYVVSSDIFQPQETPSANLTLRIPAEKFEATLTFIRSLGLKVSSENTNSQDVTDEYIDLEGRLKSAQATKAQFLAILERAVTVEDILHVQTELNRIQTEIEQTKGRIDYLQKNGQYALLTVYLAVDEGELPYVPPSEKWRPDVAFKQAIRSLLGTFKDLSYKAIWLLVYSVIIIPVGIIILLVKRRLDNRFKSQP